MKEKVSNDIRIEIPTTANSNTAELMVKESTPGATEKSLTASGTKDSSKATASGKESRMTATLESGRILKHMGMEFTSGLMETDMKDNGKIVLSMGKELTTLQMVNRLPVNL